MGIAVIVQSVMSHQWFGVIFGGYFASMGLFAFGCAAGNCMGKICTTESHSKTNASLQEPVYEEVN
jgi:hypothetical protein